MGRKWFNQSLVLIGLALSFHQISVADCDQALGQLAPLARWNMREHNLKLTIRDLFPEDYVRQVEEDKGPFKLRVSFSDRDHSVALMGYVGSNIYVRVKLFEDQKNPGAMIVDQLNLQDPLRAKEKEQLGPDQSGKGLPPQVFRHVKERLFEIAKAGGFTEIRTNSQQHYAVVMLYRRFVGMEPASDKSKEILDYLDDLYAFARKELPEDQRPKDIEEFTRWLGTGGLDPAGLTEKRLFHLQNYFNTGKIDPSFQLLKNKKGITVGALFNTPEKDATNIVFFEYTQGTPQVLNWFGLAYSYALELVRKL